MEHGKLFGLLFGDGVNRVKGEVIAVLVDKINLFENAVFVLDRLYEFFADIGLSGGAAGNEGVPHHRLGVVLSGQNNRQKEHVVSVDGNHSVRSGAVIIDAVSLIQVFHIVADLNFHFSLENQVEFLTGMFGQMDGLVLKLLSVIIAHPVGLGYLLAEKGSEVLYIDAVLLCGFLSLALAGDGVGRKVGALSLEKVGNADTEGKRAFVNKGKGKVKLSGLILNIIFGRDLGFLSHLFNSQPDDFTHFVNSAGDLQQLFGVYICHFCSS